MSGIVTPSPKLTLLYKCLDCGHKFCLLYGIMRKKCPKCGSTRIKVAFGFAEKPPFPIVH